MFGIGMPEMILILAVALIVIGPKKLPDLAKSLGRAFGEFKKATNDLKSSLELDSDYHEVIKTFDSVKDDMESSVDDHSNDTETPHTDSTPPEDQEGIQRDGLESTEPQSEVKKEHIEEIGKNDRG